MENSIKDRVVVTTSCPIIDPSYSIRLVGSSKQLGEWNPSQGVEMSLGRSPQWHSSPLDREAMEDAEYKFVVVETTSGEVVAWESGENRRFGTNCTPPHFDNIELWRGTGVAIPLFSLRSESSMGIGDFADLKKMVDWVELTSQKIIQILPINDTTMSHTWEDSYPYNANSIFALHPIYISLTEAGELEDSTLQAELLEQGERLNQLSELDFVAVAELKERYMRELYRCEGEAVLSSGEFLYFFGKSSHWLEPYALFSLLRDRYNTAYYPLWGEEATYSAELLARYADPSSESYRDLAFHYYMQFKLDEQLKSARDYAHSKGVIFKGDIPIGVSRTSVDVWVTPQLFHLESQAGAPPDDFSVMGQNWGFPTYNWQEMAKDGYSWWQARFSKMAEYFDAYRIDHILGFFRIWEIPLDAVHGLLGHFSPALPFSREEMESEYGFAFDESYLSPDINQWLLEEIFGEKAAMVKERYLDGYRFKEQYNTQIKVAREVKDSDILEGLLYLFTEILFIKDPYQKDHYHPRISAQKSYKYRAMSSEDKASFDRLYNHFYYHRHNDFWQGEAMAKLPTLVEATNMLTCGEDLGMIPASVPQVMENLSILSLEIERMPKASDVTFGDTANYPYYAVSTTSTHDMNPIRAWLLEDEQLTGRYLKEVLGIEATIEDDVPDTICEAIIARHLASPAIWTILPLQDWLSIDGSLRAADPHSERINIPAKSRHYWRYRMHITLEQLLAADDFNGKVRSMIG